MTGRKVMKLKQLVDCRRVEIQAVRLCASSKLASVISDVVIIHTNKIVGTAVVGLQRWDWALAPSRRSPSCRRVRNELPKLGLPQSQSSIVLARKSSGQMWRTVAAAVRLR